MGVIQCKMCGGNLKVMHGSTVAECEFCGRKQTVLMADSDKKMVLFSRANELRRQCKFDKAASAYENLVTEFYKESEAYWGLVLCKYGIEYVDDPLTKKKIPTCHRASFDSVLDDPNYKMALKYANNEAKKIYVNEAKDFEEIRKGIIEASSKEEPYDIFICYKERDANKNRTLDSFLAENIYNALTDKGYRVFFSRIVLEEKKGEKYEPLIFSALHSAKVMLAVGTSCEHYNAVWVKNEWSRYLSLIASGEKKNLIICFKGIDTDNLPKEFSSLEAQDLGQVGAIENLVRNVGKFFPEKNSAPTQGTNVEQRIQDVLDQYAGWGIRGLLDRAYLFLEDGKFQEAKKTFDKFLDQSPREASAYWGLLLAEKQCKSNDELKKLCVNLSDEDTYKKAIRFSTGEQQRKYLEIKNCCDENLQEQERRRSNYHQEFLALKNQYNHKESDVYSEFRQQLDEAYKLKNQILSMNGTDFLWKRMAVYVLMILAPYLIPVEIASQHSAICLLVMILGIILSVCHLFRAATKKRSRAKLRKLKNICESIKRVAGEIQQQAEQKLSKLNNSNNEFAYEWHSFQELCSEAWFILALSEWNSSSGMKDISFNDCLIYLY